MNESIILGNTFPEIFRKPRYINFCQALDESGLDHYQQEQVKRQVWSDYKEGEIE